MTDLEAQDLTSFEDARPPTFRPRSDAASGAAQIRRATAALKTLLSSYAITPKPIDVSFRQLVGPIPVSNLSHSIYPYPARLLRQIPRFFLHCEQLAVPGGVVLDPFCGSGTVLIEARAAHMTGWGIDINPFARLLSRVKTTPIGRSLAWRAAGDVLAEAKAVRRGIVPDVVNVDYWFSRPVKRALGRLHRAIMESDLSPDLRRYLLVLLALSAERCSLRDPRIPVPVRRHDWQLVAAKQKAAEVWHTFEGAARFVVDRLAAIPSPDGVVSLLEGEDAAQAHEVYRSRLADRLEQPSLILTSPPYGAAQKYIRSSSLSLGWTGLAKSGELSSLERRMIGREHLRQNELSCLDTPNANLAREISALGSRDPERAAIYAHYFRGMEKVISNLATLLADGGVLVLVAGSNAVAGTLVQTHSHLKDIAMSHGLSPVLELRDTIRGRVLLTKRATRNTPLHYETVHVFRKTTS